MAAGTDTSSSSPWQQDKIEKEGQALPPCQLRFLPLLTAGVAWPCSLLGCQCPWCPGPALLGAEVPSEGRVLQPLSTQPGVRERAHLGGSGT